jgi:hypothetical protein
MNIDFFVSACESRQPVAIVLHREDYEQLKEALPDTPGDWNKREMTYRGAPIAPARFFSSYIIEDTPDGPMIHMVS